MKKPIMFRFDQDLIDQIEAYRVFAGIKSTSEATRRLIAMGLMAENRPVTGYPTAPQDQWTAAEKAYVAAEQQAILRTGSLVGPLRPPRMNAAPQNNTVHAYPVQGGATVAYAGDIKRQATPKATKGKK